MDTTHADTHAPQQSEVTRFYPGQHDAETILLEGHPSLTPSLLATAVLCIIATVSIIALLLFLPGLNTLFTLMGTAWLGCLVLIGAQGALELVARRNTKFVLTQKNLYIKCGVMRRWYTTLVVPRIQDVVVEQGPLGMVFRYGNVRVETAGERGGVVLADVPNPLAWRPLILFATAQATHGKRQWAHPI